MPLGNTPHSFKDRLAKLQADASMTQQQLADVLLITRSYLNRLLKGKKKPSPRLIQQVTQLERTGVTAVNYDQAPAKDKVVEESNQPTRADCMRYFSEYLDAAESLPGGIGHAWVHLQIYFSKANLQVLWDRHIAEKEKKT